MNRPPTTYSVDARYRGHVEAALRIAMAEAARDAVYRADEITVGYHKVEKALIDPDAMGVVTITIEEVPTQLPGVPDLDHYAKIGHSLEADQERPF